jgi:hypothetical protein
VLVEEPRPAADRLGLTATSISTNWPYTLIGCGRESAADWSQAVLAQAAAVGAPG